AALRAQRRAGAYRAGRADPGGAEGRFLGGELLAGGRHQGHLGAGKLMLARIASHLFWLSRYMERAGYLARLLQVGEQMSALRPSQAEASEWESALVASGAH